MGYNGDIIPLIRFRGLGWFFFPQGTQKRNRCGLASILCHLQVPPAKSWPKWSEYSCTSNGAHIAKKASGGVPWSTTGSCQISKSKVLASARHNAGGYSFNREVAQVPSAVLPIEALRGSSTVVRCALKSRTTLGRLRHNTVVGFGVGAPSKPWQKVKILNPGKALRRWSIGSRQIAADSSPSGSAGCSSKPMPPTRARRKRHINAKVSKRLPIRTCTSSLILKQSKPQRQASVRTMRGPWCISEVCTARARPHVSHGGPPMKPITSWQSMASNQNSCVCLSPTSPSFKSYKMSTDAVWMVTPSGCSAWISSR